MDKKIILGFAVGVIAASTVAYVATKHSRMAAPPVLSATSSSGPNTSAVPTPVPEQAAPPNSATAAAAPPARSSDSASTSTPGAVANRNQAQEKTRFKPFATLEPAPSNRTEPWTRVTPEPKTATVSQSEWHTLGAAAPASPAPPAPVVTVIPQQPDVSGPSRPSEPGPPRSPAQRDQIAILRPERSLETNSAAGAAASVRQPNVVTLNAGTQLPVRLAEGLSSDRNRAGDSFFTSLDQPVVIDGLVIAERGARVEGRVADAQMAGRASGKAQLSVELTKLHTADGQIVPIRTAAYAKQGPDAINDTVGKVGAGAAIGAIIGAIAGGGKGAAIGAGVGGAAGGGAAAASRGKPVVLPVETRLEFRVEQTVVITEQLR